MAEPAATREVGEVPATALVPGFVYPRYEVVATAEDQARRHALCGIDTARFGGFADVTHFGQESIMAARRAGISINGSVHMAQIYRQAEPIRLGERLEIRGEVVETEDTAKGRIMRSLFSFVRPDGSIPLTSERINIRLDLADPSKPPRSGGPAEEPLPTAVLERIRLVPANVAAYSDEAGNLIHSDPETARRFGFRAPIAAGLMASRFMLAALHARGRIEAVDFEIRFLRPMFWDDDLTLLGDEVDGRIARMAIVGPHGKPTSRGTVRSVSYA